MNAQARRHLIADATSRNGASVSTSVSKSTGAAAGKKSSKSRRVITIVTLVMCTLLVSFVIYVQGHVSGTEFAPSHFTSRQFSFYELPVFHWQITPIRRKATTSQVANSIRLTSLISTPKGAPAKWHLVTISRGMTGQTPADAHLLTDQLNMRQGSSSFWKTWNSDNPKHAKVLWPTVQRLANRELYVLIPELLLIARGNTDLPAQKLQSKIDSYLIDEYKSLIGDMRQAKRTDLADAFEQEMLADYPELAPANSLQPNAAGSP